MGKYRNLKYTHSIFVEQINMSIVRSVSCVALLIILLTSTIGASLMLQASMVADLNDDSVIDLTDLCLVALAWESFPGHPSWNPRADLDNNGVVDILDVVLVVRQMGMERMKANKHIVAYSSVNDDSASFIANNFDIAVVDFAYTRNLGKIKAFNPNVVVFGYRDIIAMHTTYEDWAEVNAHEDWFIHDNYGNRIRETGYGFYVMDVGSQGWRQHYAQYCLQKLAQHPTVDGIFADDCLEAKVWSRNWWSSRVSDIPSWVRETWNERMNGMLSYVKNALGNKLFIINTNDYTGGFLSHVDGMMLEGFIHGGWEALQSFSGTPASTIDVLQRLSATGKYFLVQSDTAYPGTVTDADKELMHKLMIYCFGCFLLGVNGPKASFGWLSFGKSRQIGSPSFCPEMEVETGNPKGNYYTKDGLYMRDFEYAKVIVNLSTQTRSTVVDGVTYTLEPRTATILTY